MTGLFRPVSGGAGPHAGLPMVVGGAPLADANGAMIVLHGRGGRASDIMDVARRVAGPQAAVFGPEAFHGSWYPHRFTEPEQVNEPFLGSALSMMAELVRRLVDQGVPADRIMLLGFSQGACLALECAGRSRIRLGAVFAFSGGLIGDKVEPSRYGRQDGMDALLCCAEQDPHIPVDRVRLSAAILRQIGAGVGLRTWRGREHSIRDGDVDAAAAIASARAVPALRAG